MVFKQRNANETRTKIVCTIGPASCDEETLRSLIREGMDVARVNLSHGTKEEHEEVIERIRRLADEEEAVVAILADLPGPKLRIGRLASPLDLRAGDWIAFTTGDADGAHHVIPLLYPELVAGARVGGRWILGDGSVEVLVREVRPDLVVAKVLAGGSLSSHKGVHVPGVSLAALTDADRAWARFAIRQGVDFLALSFVRVGDDVRELQALCREEPGGFDVGIVAKIERRDALEDLDDILDAADAVMIARGDLGLEIPPQEVPSRQKEIIRRCNQLGIPVVTATQMLLSMIDRPRPTRAEASDVANAILDGTDAVMLSEETAVGRYPARAVAMMREISAITEASAETFGRESAVQAEEATRVSNAISAATVLVAEAVGARLIACVTASGYTARRVSRERPLHPILALTSDDAVLRRLALVWGVTPLRMPSAESADEMLTVAATALTDAGFVEAGDLIVVTAGLPAGGRGTTNVLKVHPIE